MRRHADGRRFVRERSQAQIWPVSMRLDLVPGYVAAVSFLNRLPRSGRSARSTLSLRQPDEHRGCAAQRGRCENVI
jgi:hypothetical protein